jgi:acyl-CoA synthetase (AMP-forming)/AMP-acid ligase II
MTQSQSTPTTLLGLLTAPDDRTALIAPEQGIRITYGGLRKQVQDVAAALAAAGVKRGDRVGMALPNGIPNVVTFLAAAMAGTAAPLNPAYKEEEFKFYLDDTSAKVLLLPPEGIDDARRAAGSTVPILTVEMDASGIVSLSGTAAGAPVATPALDEPALVLHTSGSTGRPKRVPLSHANLSISAGNVARGYALSDDDVSLCVMPLFHVHGLVASTLATLATGGTVVIPAKFSPLSFWGVAQDVGATWYSAVPTIHQLLLARVKPGAPKPAGASKLRFIRSCSASLPPQVMHDLEAAFGAPVLEAYGMTEAAHQMSTNPLPPAAHLPGSVGIGTDVKISIRNADGQALPPGERGEVCIQGPNVMGGYENNPEANATAFFDGTWFRTGDQGVLDENGYLTLTGAPEGDDQPRRREDLAARDRRGAADASVGGRGGVLRHATSHLGRGGSRGGTAEGAGVGGRPACLLQGAPGRLQAAEEDPHHRRHSTHGDRQDPASRGRAALRPAVVKDGSQSS